MPLSSPLLALLLAASPGPRLWSVYEAHYAELLAPLLSEVLRFDTVDKHTGAFAAQRAWLSGAGTALGFVVRDTGAFTEVELPGPPGAPVLGLIVHGDVQPADAREWKVPPFSGEIRDGEVWGRGAADDKGPLVQALLSMAALRASGLHRTHTVRLLVGSTEEIGGTDTDYFKTREPPDWSLVLDSDFPVVVGEKAWNSVEVTEPARASVSGASFEVTGLEAGLGPAIVPDRAALRLRWRNGAPNWEPWLAQVQARPLSDGTRLEVSGRGAERTLTVLGKSAHSGVALAQGRNALVSLARLVDGLLPPSSPADLLAFAVQAGRDLSGSGLGLQTEPPPWNGFDVNVAMAKLSEDGNVLLTLNVRAPPSLYGEALKAHLAAQVRAFDQQRPGAALAVTGGRYGDVPLVLDPQGKLVRRLLAAYTRATGTKAEAVTSAGGTYAKRVPHSIPFGMWFRSKPYPGHAADEHVSLADLNAGVRILLEALGDLACGPPLERPFER